MKLKKIAVSILLISILVAQFVFVQFSRNSLAAGETPVVTINLKSNDSIDITKLHREDEFEVVARLKEVTNAGKGIVVIGATLNYDTTKLELLSFKGSSNGEDDEWKLTKNQNNGKFVLEHDGYVTAAQDILKLKFKVKANAAESTETTPSTATIGLTNITTSGGNGVIKVTSTIYKVDGNDWDISKIEPQTTIAQFLSKVTIENAEASDIVFTDKNGTVTNNNNAILKTGMKLKIADKLTYTLIVKGDLDGEANEKGEVVTENDLAMIKLHFIGHTVITNPTILKAANYDDDGNRQITVNDIAMIKLNILGLLNQTR